eukprot:3923419-Pyramimonas_sp.AAC.1
MAASAAMTIQAPWEPPRLADPGPEASDAVTKVRDRGSRAQIVIFCEAVALRYLHTLISVTA